MNSHRKALAYWSQKQKDWVKQAQGFVAAVDQIEDEAIRYAVACILDTISSGYGNIIVEREGEGVRVQRIHLDRETYAHILTQIEDELGAEMTVQEAYAWMGAHLAESQVVYLGWLMGGIKELTVPEGRRPLATLEADSIVYDMKKGRITGIRLDNGDLVKVKSRSLTRTPRSHTF